MKHLLWLLLAISLVVRAVGQSNAPVRVAIIAETTEASAVSDLLTAELSKNPQVTLLERNDIERVYREQGLSAANRDYLKLGQTLGADGVLLIRATETPSKMPALPMGMGGNQKPHLDLSTKLIAVKPGVLLASDNFSGIDDFPHWAEGFATHLAPQLPKLSVLVQDAVPISIVNFRSAIQSSETKEMERQLTTLAIERLSRERQLMVLERTKMQLLAGEKELKGLNNSAFWNGSYLLEGTIDRDGYSPGKITLSARLVPPRGGAPAAIEVSGNRTDFSQVINQLAEKVRETLNLASTAAPWNPADEAQKYFEEAKWALKWNLLEQAQSASDTAWALGKQDFDCAVIHIKAYAQAVPKVDPLVVRTYSFFDTSRHLDIRTVPSEEELTLSLRALALYEEYSHRLPTNEPKDNSPYYLLGLDTLGRVTGVLRHYHYHPESQPAVSERLADLRALARTTAAWISKSPSVRNTYVNVQFSDPQNIPHDFGYRSDLDYSGPRNFFDSELKWACFWQERPEDSLAIYRSLMTNSLFVLIDSGLWFRDDSSPRLAAWNEADRKQSTQIWQRFTAELNSSPDPFIQMEANAIAFADAKTERDDSDPFINKDTTNRLSYEARLKLQAQLDQNIETTFNTLFAYITNNFDKVISARPGLAYLNWNFGSIVAYGAAQTETMAKIHNIYQTNYEPQIGKLRGDYLANQKKRREDASALAQQQERQKGEAALQPAATPPPSIASAHVIPYPPGTFHTPAPFRPPAGNVSVPPANNAAPVKLPALTNVLVVKNFLQYPREQFHSSYGKVGLNVISHRQRDGQLMLDVRYIDISFEQDSEGATHQVQNTREAALLLDRAHQWTTIPYPHAETKMLNSDLFAGQMFGSALIPTLFVEMLDNTLYVSDRDAIREYNLKSQQWQTLPLPGQNRAQLFVVNHHLYAASSETIWEILDGGRGSRILTSVRRRPTASSLDSRDSLERPVLFPGKASALYTALNGEVFSWDGSDWKSVLTVANSAVPEVFDSTVFFRRNTSEYLEFWRLRPTDEKPVLCWREKGGNPVRTTTFIGSPVMTRPTFHPTEPVPIDSSITPLWKCPAGFSIGRAPATMDDSTVYFYIDRCDYQNAHTSSEKPIESRGRHGDLVCLKAGFDEPVIVPIRFHGDQDQIPFRGHNPGGPGVWMEGSSEFLFISGNRIQGIWKVPKVDIQAEIDRQIRERREKSESEKKALLEKHDLNHNGIIDSDEKESAINDPDYLKDQLDAIDANGNCLLEPEELTYFDANHNGTIDPAEEEGIHIVQGFLAERLFTVFDVNEDGKLDYGEIRKITGDRYSGTFLNGATDVASAKRFLEATTEEFLMGKSLTRFPYIVGNATIPPWANLPGKAAFKQRYDNYWAHEKAMSNGSKQ